MSARFRRSIHSLLGDLTFYTHAQGDASKMDHSKSFDDIITSIQREIFFACILLLNPSSGRCLSSKYLMRESQLYSVVPKIVRYEMLPHIGMKALKRY